MTGILYYDAFAYTHDRRCNYCGEKFNENDGAFVYKDGDDDKDKLYFCDKVCAEDFYRLNNLKGDLIR